jgi:Ca2+-dependent lipid-binding protein
MHSNPILTIQVVEANLTHDLSIFGKMDPYVHLSTPLGEWKSKTCRDGCKHPKWEKAVWRPLPKNFDQDLTINAFDEDDLRNKLIGGFTMPMSEFLVEGTHEKWVEIFRAKKRSSGHILLRFTYNPLQEEEEAVVIEPVVKS